MASDNGTLSGATEFSIANGTAAITQPYTLITDEDSSLGTLTITTTPKDIVTQGFFSVQD